MEILKQRNSRHFTEIPIQKEYNIISNVTQFAINDVQYRPRMRTSPAKLLVVKYVVVIYL